MADTSFVWHQETVASTTERSVYRGSTASPRSTHNCGLTHRWLERVLVTRDWRRVTDAGGSTDMSMSTVPTDDCAITNACHHRQHHRYGTITENVGLVVNIDGCFEGFGPAYVERLTET